MNRVLIVGEAPGAGRRDGRTRSRLVELSGRPLDEWADWRNLLDDWPGQSRKGSGWDARAARESAAALDVSGYEVVVLLGRRVASVVIPGGAGFPLFREKRSSASAGRGTSRGWS